MRQHTKAAAWILLVSLAVGAVFAEDRETMLTPSAEADKPPQATERPGSRLTALLEEKVKVMRDGADVSMRQFQQGRAELRDVIHWQLELRKAELAECKTDRERIAVWKRALEDAKALEEIMQAKRLAARASYEGVLRATAYRLDAEIALEMLNSH